MEQYVTAEIRDGADICFVHVSSRNKPQGRFDKYPVPDGASNIYLNSCAKNWYINGLPCWGKDLDSSIFHLQKLVASARAKKVVCIGSSMGGFGAALIASYLNADVICFAPELRLNVHSGFSRSDQLAGVLPRLEELRSPNRALVIAGLNSPSDVICAQHFSHQWTACETYILGHCGHGTARHLKNHDLLEKVIRNFVHAIDVSSLLSPLRAPETLLAGYKFVEPGAFSDVHLNEYVELLYGSIKLCETIELCAHLRKRGAFSAALKLAERVIEDHGFFAEIHLLKAQSLRQMGRHKDSMAAFMEVQKNPNFRKQALLGMSMIHKKSGRQKEARELYAQIVADARKDLDLYLPLLNETSAAEPALASIGVEPPSQKHTDIKTEVGVVNTSSSPNENAIEAAYVNLIEKHLKERDFESASMAALEGINKFPSSKLIQSKYAAISQQRKDWPAAVEKLLQLLAMEGGSRSADMYSRLVQAYRNAKQASQANAIALEALAAFPDNALIQSEYAWNAQVQQNWPAAVSRLEKLLTLQGRHAGEKAYVRLAQAYKNIGQPDKANMVLAEGLAKFPDGTQIKNKAATLSASMAKSDVSNE